MEDALPLLNLRVMTGSNLLVIVVDLLQKMAELDPLVAEDVRARRAPGPQFGEDVRNDLILILGLQRDDLERNPGLFENREGILQVILPGAIAEKREFLFKPDFEVKSRDLMRPRLLQEAQRHRAIH